MKAIGPSPLSAIPFAAAVLALTGSCAAPPPPRPVVVAVPAPRPAPRPVTMPVAVASPADWRDAAITPGGWSWAMEGAFSVARFGGGALILSCDRTGGTVTLLRPGVLDGPAPMTVITTAGARSASATPVSGPPAFAALVLTARDSVLDDMAYSRGRFAIETAGMTTLYVPSWPEVSRVVEDCR